MTKIKSGDLKFEWDQAKARANLRKHGVDFLDAPAMFVGPLFTVPALARTMTKNDGLVLAIRAVTCW